MQALTKMTKTIGKLAKIDQTTARSENIAFARCMIEVKVGQLFPHQVFFIDEKGQKQAVPISYEWSPIQCINCRGNRHVGGQCYREQGRLLEGLEA
ncbi:putative S-methyl-5'-thioinosine phosphorylase [Bienertia sinuspersici]